MGTHFQPLMMAIFFLSSFSEILNQILDNVHKAHKNKEYFQRNLLYSVCSFRRIQVFMNGLNYDNGLLF